MTTGQTEQEDRECKKNTVFYMRKERRKKNLTPRLCSIGEYSVRTEKKPPQHKSTYTVGQKIFSQPPIVQVLPLKKMREACNFHHRYTSTMRDKIRKKKSRKSHCRIFKEFICKLWWKISIWSITKFFVIYPLLAMTEVKRFL